jgi:CheY-like chemotaxis protein
VNGTVLIVDDDVNARIIAETLLRLRDLAVRSATDGLEACDLIRDEDVAVVVLELNLPAMNGFEVLRRLRSRFGSCQPQVAPRVLVVTARHEPEVERFVLRLGADAFLRKPYKPGALISTVERLLALPKAQANRSVISLS